MPGAVLRTRSGLWEFLAKGALETPQKMRDMTVASRHFL